MDNETVNAVAPLAETPVADVTTTPDAPVTPAPAATDAQPLADAKPPEATEEGEPEGEEQRKKPSGSERLKRRLALAQSAADDLARELEEERRRPRDGGNPQGKPGIDRAPTETDFPNDYLAYERANNAWQVRQAVRDEISKVENKGRETQLRELRQERLEAYEENVSQVRERIPDFDRTLAAATGVNISPALIEEIMSSDKAALLQYHLAKNPDKARELNGLSGRELAREIGRLESRVHLPKPNTQTKATPPPTQVSGGAALVVSLQNADMDQYVKIRRQEEEQRARR